MKRSIITIILTFVISLPALHADDLSITTSIYAQNNSEYEASTRHNISTTPTAKKVRLKTKIDSNPLFLLAIDKAEDLFTQHMKDMYVKLMTINAFVIFGEAGNFDPDEVCQVEVKYTRNSIGYNPLYANIGSTYGNHPVIYPKTMYQQCTGIQQDTCMIIRINPTLNLFCDTTALPDTTTQYDAVSILMRALAIGCGLQSSYTPNDETKYGFKYNDTIYITPYDTKIHNNMDMHYEEIIDSDWVSDTLFLAHQPIYAGNIRLWNDWEGGVTPNNIPTHYTFNTFDFRGYTMEERSQGFIDLLDRWFEPNKEVREITKYSKELLQSIGWMETFAVGLEVPYDITFHNSSFSCSDSILEPNTAYTLNLGNNIEIQNVSCELYSIDSTYSFGTLMNSSRTFMYDTIPQNIQWKRNQQTKNIEGQIKATVKLGNSTLYQDKICEIEIPYRPNKPLVSKTEVAQDDYIQLNLSAFANGSDTYTITYKGVNDLISHTTTISAYKLDTILNIPSTQLYNMSIYGTNYVGNSDTCRFTFGFSANPLLYMSVSVIGSTLRYDLSRNGTIDISDVTITSIRIADIMGNTVLTPGIVGSGEPIDISSLASGYYILWVEANGHTYTRTFAKRY